MKKKGFFWPVAILVAAIVFFSAYQLFGYLNIKAAQEYWLTDTIKSVNRFSDLPYDIKKDLDNKYYQSNIKSAIYWVPSTASRVSLNTISAANLINKVSGALIAALNGGQQKVYEWLAVEIAKTSAAAIISTTTGSAKAADITVWLYETGSTYSSYKKVADNTFKALTKNTQLSVEVAAWILQTEMTYINNNLSQGFQKLAGIKTGKAALEVYIVSVQGENKKNEKLFDSGMEFYYYDVNKKKFVNYFRDVYSVEIKSVKTK